MLIIAFLSLLLSIQLSFSAAFPTPLLSLQDTQDDDLITTLTSEIVHIKDLSIEEIETFALKGVSITLGGTVSLLGKTVPIPGFSYLSSYAGKILSEEVENVDAEEKGIVAKISELVAS